MTRKEEIQKAVQKSEWISKSLNLQSAFTEGAEWADKTMLDRACEWLNDIDFDMEYWSQEDGFCKEEFITDFRQAMEGGAE